jgi:hypothetical protein
MADTHAKAHDVNVSTAANEIVTELGGWNVERS